MQYAASRADRHQWLAPLVGAVGAILYQRKHTIDHYTTIRMLDITDPAIFVEAITAIQQLIERVHLVPENGDLKIKPYGELGALQKLGT